MKRIMIQGTASAVGKSVITAALCRIFKNDGYAVAPFKAQNMSLNSFVTREGLEMGRAQAVQAEACGIEPAALMNPILLKPSAGKQCQVVLMGKVVENLSHEGYEHYKPRLREVILNAYRQLADRCDIVVLEGAGSPAEINLKQNDLVNMGMAALADAPVLLVADIDRGGVFASVAGTLLLLEAEERARVKGVIINKFRGDVKLLEPGLRQLEAITGVPVLGVIPYCELHIDDEDSVSTAFAGTLPAGQEISVAVVKLPHIANFTDFGCFHLFKDVHLYYAADPVAIGEPDVVIIPGSKNTIADLHFMQAAGIDQKIKQLTAQGKVVIGICAGYQMLGRSIHDPAGVDGACCEGTGLGILDLDTTMERIKTTVQVETRMLCGEGLFDGMQGLLISGYEIHKGSTRCLTPLTQFIRTETENCGVVSGNVIGTYLHGIFDNTLFTRQLLNNIRKRKGLGGAELPPDYREFKEREYNRLADLVKAHLDITAIYKIMELQ